MTTFCRNKVSASVLEQLAAQLRFAVMRYQLDFRVRVRAARVPEELALQYAWEGSCGPSGMALLKCGPPSRRRRRQCGPPSRRRRRLSMLRLMRGGAAPGPDFEQLVFRRVREEEEEEEVVAAVQLLHSVVV